MSAGKCSTFIAISLYPLVLMSIVLNVVLFFPAGDPSYAREGHITPEVKYFGGIIGGGMVLTAALFVHLTGAGGCCGNRCGMLLSMAFAGLGLLGALYAFVAAALGVHNGPLCRDGGGAWTSPFRDSDGRYLTDHGLWNTCEVPRGIVTFNLGLFVTLMVVSGLQGVLCGAQVLNGLVGCVCGAGADKKQEVA